MFKAALIALSMLSFAASSEASSYVITQTYSQVAFSPYNVPGGVEYGQTPTGEWIFKGTVDTTAVNVSDAGYNVFNLDRITLTQASLGLYDVAITNVPFLWFSQDRFGFTGSAYGGTPWSVTVYEPGHFAGANSLQELLARATTPAVVDPYNSFGPQWTGYALEDGRSVYGWGFGPSAISISAVPEPATVVLFALGAFVMLGAARSRAHNRR